MTNISVCDRPKHIRQSIERKKLVQRYKYYDRQLKIELLKNKSKSVDFQENTNQLRFLLRKLKNIENLLS